MRIDQKLSVVAGLLLLAVIGLYVLVIPLDQHPSEGTAAVSDNDRASVAVAEFVRR